MKKIITYDYQIKAIWTLAIAGDKNEIRGEMFFPEISNDVIDDGEEWEARVSLTIGSDRVNSFIKDIIKE